MKLLIKILFTLAATCFITNAYAGNESGKDSAKYYKTYPDKWDKKSVSVDCASVKRMNAGPQIEGVTFFTANTVDDKNNAYGGSIIVAVLDADTESFVRKYGTVVERDRGSSERIDNNRLRGTFHQLERGHVYIDTSASGEANELILANLEAAKQTIQTGESPQGATGATKRFRDRQKD